MATTNLGKVSVTPKGEYDPLVTYERLDVISHNGSGYIVKQASTGVTPIEGEFYALIAEKGDGGSFLEKSYKTYAAMELDKPNLAANISTRVSNDSDTTKNGSYTYDGTVFTRSQYDSKVVTDKIIADTAIAVQDAINNTAVEGGVLADTFVVVDGSLSQRTINRGLESIADLSTINNPKDGLRVYVKSYHAGLGKGGGLFSYISNHPEDANGITIFKFPNGVFTREEKAVYTLYDCGLVDNDISLATQNSQHYNEAYPYLTSAAGISSLKVPEGIFYISEPLVVGHYKLYGAEAMSGKHEIALVEANPSTVLEAEDLGAWGVIDYTNIIAPIIVKSSYYSSLEGVKISTRNLTSEEVTHGVFGGLARHHKYDNLLIHAKCKRGFESFGGFLSNYGSMEIRNADEGIYIGPGSNQLGVNTPTFKNLWINGVKGYAFYSHGATQMRIDNLYIEAVGNHGGVTPLINFRTARNLWVKSILFDGIDSNVNGLIEFRGSNAIIEGLSIMNIRTVAPTPIFTLNGGVSLQLNSMTVGGNNNMYAIKRTSLGATDKVVAPEYLYIHSGTNYLLDDLYTNGIEYSRSFNTADRWIENAGLVKLKSVRNSQIVCNVELSGISSGTGFTGTEQYVIKINTDGSLVTKVVTNVLDGSTSSTPEFSLVADENGLVDLKLKKINTTYGSFKLNIKARHRGQAELVKPEFYTY